VEIRIRQQIPLWVGGLLGGLLVALVLFAARSGVVEEEGHWTPGRQVVSGAPVSSGPSPTRSGEIEALIREGISPGQAGEALDIQEEIAQTALVSRLESALGNDFGGAWYSPASALLHVRVVSPAARAAAEALARRAGLAARVVTAPTRFGWEELRAGQRRWNREHEDLFAREQAVSWLSPQDGVIEIELSGSLPPSTVSGLRRQAADAAVPFSIKRVDVPRIGLERLLGKCETFASTVARCDPSIAGGVRIEEVKKQGCTAGPAVLKTDLSQETTETFLLTAGHCIAKTTGLGGSWFAYNKEGTKREEIGKAVAVLNKTTDVGVIKVENKFWTLPENPPVVPRIAPWGVGKEPEPFGVPGQIAPGVGNTTCYEGQVSGEACGTISKLNVTLSGIEELVEVSGTTAQEGDSGAPFFSTLEKSLHWVEGTLVGRSTLTGRPFYQTLSTSFLKLEPQISLELLTQANEVRPENPMK
jgi:hypothetical protein